MIDNSNDITRFLPIQIGDGDIIKYIRYHADNLDKSIEHNIESGIFFHVHILYMTFIYFQLLRISKERHKEFRYSWILSSQEREFFKNPSSPFSFAPINEKTVFKFFRLLDFDDGFIGDISACVNERNDMSHATGVAMSDLDRKIEKYIGNMERVIDFSKDFICSFYAQFLADNSNWFETGYVISRDDIETNLLNPYSISPYEIGSIILPIEENTDLKKLYEDYR